MFRRLTESIILAFALASSHSALAASAQDRTIAQLERAPEQLVRLMTVKGDDLDPSITVTSYNVTIEYTSGILFKGSNENSFLRAFIDRKTGSVTAQIYHIAYYKGGWNFYNRATYETPGGPKEVAVDKIDSNVNCQYAACLYTEEVGIPIDFSYLEYVATLYTPQNAMNSLKYRIFAKSGQTIDDGIPLNEIAAFVSVIHQRGGK